MLTNKSLTTFRTLYLREYGEQLSEAKARELGENLVNLYRAVYLPIKNYPTEAQYEKAH